MSEDENSDWYLLDQDHQTGPLDEGEMRTALAQSSSENLQVRQGNSAWFNAESVRAKIEQLERYGISFRCDGVQEGPFTLTRAYHLLDKISPEGIEIRTGAEGKWVAAERWLAKIEDLRHRSDLELNALSEALQRTLAKLNSPQVSSTNLLRVSNETFHGIAIEDTQEMLTSDVFASTKTKQVNPHPVAGLTRESVQKSSPAPSSTPTPASSTSELLTPVFNQKTDKTKKDMLQSDSAALSDIKVLQSKTPRRGTTSRRAKPKPRARRRDSSFFTRGSKHRRFVWIASALAVLVLVGIFYANMWFGQESDVANGSETNTLGIAQVDLTSSESQSVPKTDDLEREPSSPGPKDANRNVNANVESEFQDAPIEDATSPPKIANGSLFRPRFDTSVGMVDAGTAFATCIEGTSGVFVISALHLFGPSGGLEANVPSEELPTVWRGLKLEDCRTRNWFGAVGMRPVMLRDAKPFPEVSVFGDVAACVVTDDAGFNPFPLATRRPKVGDPVWMIARIQGTAEMIHAAKVNAIDDGWLMYEFEQPDRELKSTIGAPIVDRWGEVVAVNSGGGESNPPLIGVGTPVTRFLGALRFQLEKDQ